jgi:hypothetical protein
MEITLPRARGLLAKTAGSFPGLARRLADSMMRTGLRNQAKMK